ncbi:MULTISPECIES: DUF3795 domain-containing protein [unclassified Fusibacter]|uniref:DUF3795 domain-containing protein n=1 Tax=unclassified Fusibacter TaxID=2624464 RepID=UPI0010127229|nr:MULTISPECIES: DUF3795 domain-containing protein [unclassified Fusibacter]MCK8059250.1 DUF3795 domain-containing protein [Fusibacter sp. A2]NPE21286.1 DUF3795 domain-containing protein [Fusibacter sp. A1]RXV62551.1 DUF3795 domain-containing protein [Fusibacter sp. A1]
MERKTKIGSCGLACVVCSYECEGCVQEKAKSCEVKACSMEKGVGGCHACKEFPCEKDLFKNKRVMAFNCCARDMGVDAFADKLLQQQAQGVEYHKADQSPGDYDVMPSQEAIEAFIKS